MYREIIILLVAIVLILKIQTHYNMYKLEHADGAIIQNTPYQKFLIKTPQIPYKDAKLTFLAEYRIDGMVLSKKLYNSDHFAPYSPCDLLLGWGPLSDPQILKHIYTKQGGRRGQIRYKNSSPVPKYYAHIYMANIHCIPADDSILKAIVTLQPGEIIHLEGYLVELRTERRFWKSSLSRSDTGDRACEIYYIQQIKKTGSIVSTEKYQDK